MREIAGLPNRNSENNLEISEADRTGGVVAEKKFTRRTQNTASLESMMAEKAHTDVSNNEAMRCTMRWTMTRCGGRCSDAMHDGAMLCGDGMHDEAMRCTMRRCDGRRGDAMGRCDAR